MHDRECNFLSILGTEERIHVARIPFVNSCPGCLVVTSIQCPRTRHTIGIALMVVSHCKGILNCFHRLIRMKENFLTRLLHIGIAPFCTRIMVKQAGAALLGIGTVRSAIVYNINGLRQSKCLLCRHIHSRADGYIFLLRPVTNEHKAVAHYCAAMGVGLISVYIQCFTSGCCFVRCALIHISRIRCQAHTEICS